MPPLRTERAGKACDNCRRQKTRCYPTESNTTCLRCRTKHVRCSLGSDRTSLNVDTQTAPETRLDMIDGRLARLEDALNVLVERTLPLSTTAQVHRDENAPNTYNSRQSSTELDPAPVLMIRNAAHDMTITSIALTDQQAEQQISLFMQSAEANRLLQIFQTHYGRWVRIPEEAFRGPDMSKLLLCSIYLIVLRHSEQVNEALAPALLRETKRLLGHSLLGVIDSLDTFRSLLVLSLWSTSVGGEPLGIDGWLLTSYAIHHGRIGTTFQAAFKKSSHELVDDQIDAWCIWNHICVAHLQYCVGTGRLSTVDKSIVAICSDLTNRAHSLDNFEARMIAEVKLYYITYQHSSNQKGRDQTEEQLTKWKHECADLFTQPRAQFLQMGYYFALLLTTTRSIRRNRSHASTNFDELIRLITSILRQATETIDERAQYLTDHIYHIVVFSALLLCQMLSKHEIAVKISHDVSSLDSLVLQTIEWLRSIGTSSHVTHLLARVLESQFRKSRPARIPEATTFPTPEMNDPMFAFPEYLMADFYNYSDGTISMWQDWQDIN